jgi:hypothetical protein
MISILSYECKKIVCTAKQVLPWWHEGRHACGIPGWAPKKKRTAPDRRLSVFGGRMLKGIRF